MKMNILHAIYQSSSDEDNLRAPTVLIVCLFYNIYTATKTVSYT